MLFATNSRVSQWLLVSAATLTLGASFGACKKDEKDGKDEKAGDEKSATLATGEMVTLTKEGAKIDPPAKMDQIPDGAWMCDMGTVHFAASEKGEGTCGICGMPLVQKGAKDEPAAEPAAGAKDGGTEPAAAADKPADDKAADDKPAGGEPAAAIDGGAKAKGDHAGHTH